MRHDLEFQDWLNDAYEHVNRQEAAIVLTADDVRDDWSIGTDPGDVVDRIVNGRHRHFKMVVTGGKRVFLSNRTPAANIDAQIATILN
ncbi:MAG TPA: hypothetical protein PL070_08655 [Flavobacteriales bacterium]|nr:hypothetical protein [Flavobacteriales bacterium]